MAQYLETVIEPRVYHTINEVKNGQGPAPLKTSAGWLHIAHGVRNTAAGLRYVVYAFLSDLKEPNRVTHRPSGYLIAPFQDELRAVLGPTVNFHEVYPASEAFIAAQDAEAFVRGVPLPAGGRLS